MASKKPQEQKTARIAVYFLTICSIVFIITSMRVESEGVTDTLHIFALVSVFSTALLVAYIDRPKRSL